MLFSHIHFFEILIPEEDYMVYSVSPPSFAGSNCFELE